MKVMRQAAKLERQAQAGTLGSNPMVDQAWRAATAAKEADEARQRTDEALPEWRARLMRERTPISCFCLGVINEQGRGVPQNKKLAFGWYCKAAEGGLLEGLMAVATACLQRWPGSENTEKVVPFLKQGAHQGVVEAMVALSNLYYEQGAKQKALSAQEAYAWIQTAIKGSPSGSAFFLRWIALKDGWDRGRIDLKEAIASLEESARLNTHSAINLIGHIYAEGKYGVVKDEKKAFAYFLQGAKLGEATPMRNLARAYFCGLGTKRDLAKAKEWFLKAIAVGKLDVNDLYQQFSLYRKECRGDPACVVLLEELVAALAEKESPHAIWDLCQKETGEALVKRVELLKALAEKGIAQAQACFAIACLKGIGVPVDPPQAILWSQKAADASNYVGIFNLGVCYTHGHGVAVDLTKAKEYFVKAVELNPEGVYQALIDTASGQVGPNVLECNLAMYRALAERGHVQATFALALLYHEGKVVQQDFAEAAKLFAAAAEKGDEKAAEYLGWYYRNGQGVSKDLDAAIKLLQPFTTSAICAWNLSLAYREKQDLPASLKALKRAAHLGNQSAMFSLAVSYLQDAKAVPEKREEMLKWMTACAKYEREDVDPILKQHAADALEKIYSRGLFGVTVDYSTGRPSLRSLGRGEDSAAGAALASGAGAMGSSSSGSFPSLSEVEGSSTL